MIPFFVGLGVALVATAATIPLLARAGVWDVANHRSSHTGAIPRGGGIGIVAGVLAGVLASGAHGSRAAWTIVGLLVAMAAIGLADDFSGIRVGTRLLGQVIVAVTAAALLAQTSRTGWAVVVPAVVGALWLVSYVNAFNFMDGINGISAVSGALAGAWYAWVGHRIESNILVLFGLALLGACLGFLPWNAPRARVFLGDAGSYGVGALIGALALVTWLSGAGLTWTLAPLAIYLADTAWVLVKRAGRKTALGVAHREHVYQRLGGRRPVTRVDGCRRGGLRRHRVFRRSSTRHGPCRIHRRSRGGRLPLSAHAGRATPGRRLMRIGMISQWYEPEPGAAAHPTAIARALQRRGHDVQVLTGFPNYPHGVIYDGYHQQLRQFETRDGVRLLRVPLRPSHDSSGVNRALTLSSFAASAAFQVGWLRNVDVCLVYLTPATVGVAARVLRRLAGVPYVLNVQDLWPESVVASGFLGNRRIAAGVTWALNRFLHGLYLRAAATVAIAPTMAASRANAECLAAGPRALQLGRRVDSSVRPPLLRTASWTRPGLDHVRRRHRDGPGPRRLRAALALLRPARRVPGPGRRRSRRAGPACTGRATGCRRPGPVPWQPADGGDARPHGPGRRPARLAGGSPALQGHRAQQAPERRSPAVTRWCARSQETRPTCGESGAGESATRTTRPRSRPHSARLPTPAPTDAGRWPRVHAASMWSDCPRLSARLSWSTTSRSAASSRDGADVTARVAVLGATGFVGTAVCEALVRHGAEIAPVTAPRLRTSARTATAVAPSRGRTTTACPPWPSPWGRPTWSSTPPAWPTPAPAMPTASTGPMHCCPRSWPRPSTGSAARCAWCTSARQPSRVARAGSTRRRRSPRSARIRIQGAR